MHSTLIETDVISREDNPKTTTMVKGNPAKVVNGTDAKNQAPPETVGWRQELDDDDHAVLALRNLIFDICNYNGGGHGGSAIGMSAIGVALYKYVMRYNPSDHEWFDRDRFVLSNGEYQGIAFKFICSPN
jgi:hypothetical protein